MANNRSEPQWKAEIDRVHQKHLDNIQADGVDGLAFHYTSPSGLLGIFSKQNIWFSDCDYLNDSSESDYFFDLSSTVFGTASPSKMVENLSFRSYLLAMFHPLQRLRRTRRSYVYITAKAPQKAIGDMDFSISPMLRTTTYGITSLFVAAEVSRLFFI